MSEFTEKELFDIDAEFNKEEVKEFVSSAKHATCLLNCNFLQKNIYNCLFCGSFLDHGQYIVYKWRCYEYTAYCYVCKSHDKKYCKSKISEQTYFPDYIY